MKKLLSLLVFCLPLSLVAQVSIAPVAGINFNHYQFNYVYKNMGSLGLLGLKGGALLNIRLSKKLDLQPGAYYFRTFQSFWNLKFPDKASNDIKLVKINVPEIEIPVNLIYKWNVRGHDRMFFGGGLFVRRYFRGQATAEVPDQTGHIRHVKLILSLFKQRLDYGLNINGGYELKNGLFARLQGQLGLTNLNDNFYYYLTPYSPMQGRNSSVYSSNFSLSIGYLIGKKAKVTPKQSNNS